MPDREPPILDFLEESAGILEPQQFAKLTEFLAKRHEEHRQAMAERRQGRAGRGGTEGFRGRRGGLGDASGPRLEAMADELGLTEEQRTLVQAAIQEHHEATRELHEARAAGSVDQAAFRERANALRDELRESLEGILTAEQLERMDALRTERRSERMERREARAEERAERGLEFLTRVLKLTDSQREQVSGIIESARQQHEALRESVQSGEIEPEEAHDQMAEIHVNAVSAIRALLTPEQVEIFDALQNLMPGDRPGLCPGLGLGPGGPRGGHWGGKSPAIDC